MPKLQKSTPNMSMSCPGRKEQIREKIEQQQERLQHQLQPQGDMSGPPPRLDSMAEFPPPEPRQLARTPDTTQTTTPTTVEVATQTVHTPNIYHTKDTETICITQDTLKTLLKGVILLTHPHADTHTRPMRKLTNSSDWP